MVGGFVGSVPTGFLPLLRPDASLVRTRLVGWGRLGYSVEVGFAWVVWVRYGAVLVVCRAVRCFPDDVPMSVDFYDSFAFCCWVYDGAFLVELLLRYS